MSRCHLAIACALIVSACGRLRFDPLDDGSTSVIIDVPSADAAFGALAQTTYIKASNTPTSNGGGGDHFGGELAMSADGTTLVASAWGEQSLASGVNGSQADDMNFGCGAAYVFTRTGETWMQQAYLKSSDTIGDMLFGYVVAISADGNTLAVAARNEPSSTTGINSTPDTSDQFAGAAYIFTRSGGTWTQQAYIKASNTNNTAMTSSFFFFGASLAMSADGNTVAVGASYDASNATGVNGNQMDRSAIGAGAVYVFTRNGTTWTQQAYVKASNTGGTDLFGSSVALSGTGDTLAVGAYLEASATVANPSDNSLMGAGAVYTFTRSGGTWTQQAYLKAATPALNANFGFSVALSQSGDTLAVGAETESSAATGIDGDESDTSASSAGAAYVLSRAGTSWTQQAYVKATNTRTNAAFGWTVALTSDGSTLLVGSPGETSMASGIDGSQANAGLVQVGAAYLLQRTGTTWRHVHYIKPSNPDVAGGYGVAIALSAESDVLAIGSFSEASAARGIDGDQTDMSSLGAGAVYVYR